MAVLGSIQVLCELCQSTYFGKVGKNGPPTARKSDFFLSLDPWMKVPQEGRIDSQ